MAVIKTRRFATENNLALGALGRGDLAKAHDAPWRVITWLNDDAGRSRPEAATILGVAAEHDSKADAADDAD
jgi:hypothetical protein